ncbi:MAG: leucyl aminopeptidase family protein, partial [Bacteroidota bacterium]
MNLFIENSLEKDENCLYLISDLQELEQSSLSDDQKEFIKKQFNDKSRKFFMFNMCTHYRCIQFVSKEKKPENLEELRKKGSDLNTFCNKEEIKHLKVIPLSLPDFIILTFLEGALLSSYRYMKHRIPEENKVLLSDIVVLSNDITHEQLIKLSNLEQATRYTKDFVNDPPNTLTATTFAYKIHELCQNAGARVEVLGKGDLERLEMNGILTVNKGSVSDPAFTIIEWKPDHALQTQPVVLVGKGLVFDTGGINLKPTNGLIEMKSDMAGGAAVFGAMYALAKNNVPVYTVGLIPCTDNRPGEDAMVPGDVIRYNNGKTVEIINTDAEGRLILADALLYAKKYDPRVVIDIATLTGAAQVALGKHAIAAMHENASGFITKLEKSGWNVFERIHELPFWEEYDADIISDIADIRNLGKGRGAGTITAGKFLAHFVSYPWIHLDIASTVFSDISNSYR